MKFKVFAFADEANKQMDAQIAAMRRNGLDGLEMRGVDGANVSELSDATAKICAEKLRAAGLRVWSIGSPIGKIDAEKGKFASERERLRRIFEVAHIVGAENVRIFSFYIPKERDPAEFRSKILDELGVYAEMAKAEGLTLCHENEKGIYGDNAERCLEILKTVPGIRGVFDPANFVQCGVDTLEAWNLLKPYIFYLHIKDALKNGLVVPSGDGDGHVGEIVRDFACSGGEVCTIEPHIMKFVGLGDLERAGEESVVGGGKYSFASRDEAFDFAVASFKKVCGEAL